MAGMTDPTPLSLHAKMVNLKVRETGARQPPRVSRTAANGTRTSWSLEEIKPRQTQGPDPRLSTIEIDAILRDRIRNDHRAIRQAFTALDVGHLGTVSASEFERVIDNFCLALSKDQHNKLYHKIPVNPDGTITYDTFMEMFLAGHSRKKSLPLGRTMTSPLPQPITEEELEQEVREKISGQVRAVTSAFQMFDRNQEGRVRKADLSNVLQAFCLTMTAQQFERLWDKYDVDGDGTIDYVKFIQHLGRIPVTKSQPGSAASSKVKDTERRRRYRREELAQRIVADPKAVPLGRLEAQLKNKVQASQKMMEKAFHAIDAKRIGFVTADELHAVIDEVAMPLTDDMFEALLLSVGMEPHGQLSYADFMRRFLALEAGQTFLTTAKEEPLFNPVVAPNETLDIGRILELLRTRIAAGSMSLRDIFLKFDDDRDGKVSSYELRRILDLFGATLPESLFREVMTKLDPRNTGFFSYATFLEWFAPKEETSAHKWLDSVHRYNRTRTPAKMTAEQVKRRLQTKIAQQWKTVAEAFKAMDENSDGMISPAELQRFLDQYCMPMTDGQFQQLWVDCDINNDGRLQFSEFLKHLGLDVNPGDLVGLSQQVAHGSDAFTHKRHVDHSQRMTGLADVRAQATGPMSPSTVESRLKNIIQQSSSNLRRIFQQYDRNDDGMVSQDELREVLEGLGIELDDTHFLAFLNHVGFSDERVNLKQFMALFHHDKRPALGGNRQRDETPVLFQKPSKRPVMSGKASASVMLSAVEVAERLRERVCLHYKDMYAMFAKFDTNSDGVVSRAEFRRVLDSYHFSISHSEMDKLLLSIGIDSTRPQFNYVDFLAFFQPREDVEAHKWLKSHQKSNTSRRPAYLSAEEARGNLMEKAATQSTELSKAFRAFDSDGDGLISKDELHGLLSRFSMPVLPEEFDKLWKRFDVDRSGRLAHSDFFKCLGVDVPGHFDGHSETIAANSLKQARQHRQQQEAKMADISRRQGDATERLSGDQVYQQLQEKLHQGFPSLREAFRAADKNKDGFVSQTELCQLLQSSGYVMGAEQFGEFLARAGLYDRANISYEDFLLSFQSGLGDGERLRQQVSPTLPFSPDLSRPGAPTPLASKSPPAMTTDEVIERLSQKMATKYRTMHQAFQAVDSKGTGSVAPSQLRRVLDRFCLKLTDNQFQELIRHIDTNRDGTIQYAEFLKKFQQQESLDGHPWLVSTHHVNKTLPPRRMSAGEVAERLKTLLKDKHVTIAKAFMSVDADRSGTISVAEFRTLLERAAFRLADDQFDQLWKRFDVNHDGLVDYVEFLRQFAGISPGDLEGLASQMTDQSELTQQRHKASQKQRMEMIDARVQHQQQFTHKQTDELHRLLQEKLASKSGNLLSMLKQLDSKGTGRMTKRDFVQLLQSAHFVVSEAELGQMWKRYDEKGHGSIPHRDFIRQFTLASPPRGINTSLPRQHMPVRVVDQKAASVVGLLRSHLLQDWKGLRRAFKAMDKNRDGFISAAELRATLQRYKLTLTEEQFYHLLATFDHNLDGRISYEEFIRTCFS